MSAGPDPRSNAQVIEQERRRLSQRLDEVARLCEGTLPPTQFYGELLQRLIESLAAVAGSVWVKTSQGNLQQQFQINMQQVGLDADDARSSHDMLLRFAFTNPQNLHLPPRSAIGPPGEGGKPAPGNPTGYLVLLVPIKQNDEVIGLIEIFQGPNRPAAAVPGFLQYMAMMADLAGRYQRNQLVGHLVGQQALWGQLETFARNVHSSLNPVEVSYHVANEGRRLVECDRISVANRRGGHKTQIEAVSGSDTVEKRSNQVRLMRRLADAVLDWGERLVYCGGKDDSLPPRVVESLDEYLAETPSKLLVVQPLKDERQDTTDKEKMKDRPKAVSRSALIMECFETPDEMQQTMARLEVVARHASIALHNAIEHYRIPGRWIWKPLATLQEGLGGKTKSITMLVVAALSIIVAGLIVVPYPLKVEATGNALPKVRRFVFSPVEGRIVRYDVKPEDLIDEDRSLVHLYDSTLASKIRELEEQMRAAELEANELTNQAKEEVNPAEKAAKLGRAALKNLEREFKEQELKDLLKRTHGDKNAPGNFHLIAPPMTADEKRSVEQTKWTILNSNFREQVPIDRTVRPNEPILRLGAKEGEWELEMKIPQKHVGQVLRGFKKRGYDKPLDVQFIMLGDATAKYHGKLDYEKIAGEATPDTDAPQGQEPEPVVLAYVRISGADIPEGDQIPRERLLTGSGVRAKILCGDYAAGYSLFYGVWEFLYEKVVFYLF